MPRITSDRRLYMTADGRVVEEGDPESAWLLVAAGRQIDEESARRLGLTVEDGVVLIGDPVPPAQADDPEPDPEPETDEGPDPEPDADLPEGMPKRAELLDAGLDTVERVTACEDLSAVPGIGKASEEKIRAYLAEGAV